MSVFTFPGRFAAWLAVLGAVALFLGACAGRVTPPTPTPSSEAVTLPAPSPTTVMATATPFAATPTTMPTPTAAVATVTPSEPTPITVVDWAAFESRTADGFYERGNPDAPILIRDYSDFL